MRSVALALLLVGCAHSEPPPPARSPYALPPGFKNVPSHVFEVESLERPAPRLTDATKQHYAGKTPELVGLYKLCVAMDGAVVDVKTITAVPESNDAVVAALGRWKFRPQPVPVCSIVKLILDVTPPPAPPKAADPPVTP